MSLSYSCKKVTKEHAYFSFRLKKKSKTKEIRITLTYSKRLIRVNLIAEKHKKIDLIFCFDYNVSCCFCRGEHRSPVLPDLTLSGERCSPLRLVL